MKDITKVFKAFADEKRIRILKLLEKRKMCVCELAYVLDIAQPSVSKHIKKMVKAGLLESEKDGFWTNYFIKPNNLYAKKLLSVLSAWLNDDATIKADYKKALDANREKLCCNSVG